ncbi:unnamed protein product [Penicillium glandicola]
MAFCLPIALLPLCYPYSYPTKKEFKHLPAEMKLSIIKQLDGDTLTLSRVAACNWELHNMAMPVLYAHVSLGAPPHYRIWPGLAWPADRRSVERFLLTILRNPRLARLVKSLDLSDLHDLCHAHRQCTNHPRRKQLVLEPLLPQDHRMVMEAGMKLPLYSTIKQSLCKALEPDIPRSDALLAVLLGYLPSLERLEISMERDEAPREPGITDWSLVERVLISIAGVRSMHNGEDDMATLAGVGLPTLSKLTHLKAEVEGDLPSADVDWLLVLLRIPTLTHVFGTKWTKTHDWLRPVPSISNHLVHLELRDCTFDDNILQRILKQTTKLQTFIYERGWTKTKRFILKSSDLSQALQCISQTLTCLELSFNPSGRKIYEDLYLQPLNLTGLSRLKNLRISAGYLVQTEKKMSSFEGRYWRLYDQSGAYNSALPLHELLPKSLEQLHVFQIHNGLEFILVCDKLCQTLHDREVPIVLWATRRFHHLREIKIEAPFEDKGCYLFAELLLVTTDAGVKLTTIENSADYVTSWITRTPRVSCADKKIDWGFDGEIQWAHPYTRRGQVDYDLR